MSGGSRVASFDREVVDRWYTLAGDIPSLAVVRPLPRAKPPEAGQASQPTQVLISQMFVAAEPASRRALDLFCAVLTERGPAGPDGDRGAELVLLGPEDIRAQTSVEAGGLMTTDLRIGPVRPQVQVVSLMLMSVTRASRAHDVMVAIEDLGHLLNYQDDRVGSVAVANAVIRRLEILKASPGVGIPVLGTVTRAGESAGANPDYLIAGPRATLAAGGGLGVREGRVVLAGAGGGPVPWRDGSFMLVRFGQPAPRRGETRQVAQLRREHALVEARLHRGEAAPAQSYTSQRASARQSSRAEQIVQHARLGDNASALEVFREAAAADPGTDAPLIEGLASRIGTIEDYWQVRDVLRRAADAAAEPGSPETGNAPGDADEVTRRVAAQAQDRISDRLDELLGLATAGPALPPVITDSLTMEIGTGLLPFFGPGGDGGAFLEVLMPGVRQRVSGTLGVLLPSVHISDNGDFAVNGFTIAVDHVKIVNDVVRTDGPYAIWPLGEDGPLRGAEPTDSHPLTSEPGAWQVTAAANGAAAGPAEPLAPEQYLIHRIEMAFRKHARDLLGIQEVDNLVGRWTATDRNLVLSALPDRDSIVRFTWVVQTLVSERVPIVEWPRLLAGIREAGGITMPLQTLVRAARAHLHDRLPGPRTGRRVLRVPPEFQAALARPAPAPHAGPHPAVGEFQQWLDEQVSLHGAVLSLVARDDEAREAIAPPARSRCELVTTFTEQELVPR